MSMPEWIEVSSMDLSTLRETLTAYKKRNEENMTILEKEGEDDPQDMTYEDAMILDDEFEIEHLYHANITTLRRMAREVIKRYSFPFAADELENMTRAQLICQLYEFLYLVLEHQGFAKGGVVVCPTIDNNDTEKSVSPIQTTLNTSKKPRVHSPINSTKLDVETTIKTMLELTFEEIEKATIDQTRHMITAFASKYNRPLDASSFTKTPINLLRDQLLIRTIELHTYFTPSILHESIPELFLFRTTHGPSIQSILPNIQQRGLVNPRCDHDKTCRYQNSIDQSFLPST